MTDVTIDNVFDDETDLTAKPTEPTNETKLRRLDKLFDSMLKRVRNRMSGKETPIPVPWPSIASMYGRGLWPGMHVLVAGTGTGKSAYALQMALHAAIKGCAVAYVGLELDEMQVALRVVADQTKRVPWGDAYVGQIKDEHIGYLEKAANELKELNLPFYPDFGPTTGGWEMGRMTELASSMREAHKDGPIMIVVDFLQLVGDSQSRDLRERVGAVAYAAREVARKFDAVVLLVSSTSRDKYGLVGGGIDGSLFAIDKDGKHRLENPDMLVGLGKESGEIEFAADSVTVLIRAPYVAGLEGRPVAFAVPKCRHSTPTWAPMLWDKTRFLEPTNVARMVGNKQSLDREVAIEAIQGMKDPNAKKPREKSNGEGEKTKKPREKSNGEGENAKKPTATNGTKSGSMGDPPDRPTTGWG